MSPGSSGFGPVSSAFGPGSSAFGPGSSAFGPGPSGFGHGASGFGPTSEICIVCGGSLALVCVHTCMSCFSIKTKRKCSWISNA